MRNVWREASLKLYFYTEIVYICKMFKIISLLTIKRIGEISYNRKANKDGKHKFFSQCQLAVLLKSATLIMFFKVKKKKF